MIGGLCLYFYYIRIRIAVACEVTLSTDEFCHPLLIALRPVEILCYIVTYSKPMLLFVC